MLHRYRGAGIGGQVVLDRCIVLLPGSFSRIEGKPSGQQPAVVRILRFVLQPRALIRALPAELVTIASHVGDRHIAVAMRGLKPLQVLQALVEGRTKHLPHEAQLVQ